MKDLGRCNHGVWMVSVYDANCSRLRKRNGLGDRLRLSSTGHFCPAECRCRRRVPHRQVVRSVKMTTRNKVVP